MIDGGKRTSVTLDHSDCPSLLRARLNPPAPAIQECLGGGRPVGDPEGPIVERCREDFFQPFGRW